MYIRCILQHFIETVLTENFYTVPLYFLHHQHVCYLEEVAERQGIPGEGKAVPRSPGGSSLEGEDNHIHPDVRVCVCVCRCVHVCVCVCN